MNTEELKRYLQYVKMLEARAYEQKRIYNKLSNKIHSLENRKYKEPKKELETDPDGSLAISVLILGGIGAFIGLFFWFT